MLLDVLLVGFGFLAEHASTTDRDVLAVDAGWHGKGQAKCGHSAPQIGHSRMAGFGDNSRDEVAESGVWIA